MDGNCLPLKVSLPSTTDTNTEKQDKSNYNKYLSILNQNYLDEIAIQGNNSNCHESVDLTIPSKLQFNLGVCEDETSVKTTPQPQQNNRLLPKESTSILEDWFNSNITDPFPDLVQIQELVKKSGLNPIQVKTWLQNQRRRSKAYLEICSIAQSVQAHPKDDTKDKKSPGMLKYLKKVESSGFLYQLTKMLSTPTNKSIIEWSTITGQGRIEVHNPTILESKLLCKYFRLTRYDSFRRQLNNYGFRKIAGKTMMSPCSFVNDDVTCDLHSLLLMKQKGAVGSSGKNTNKGVISSNKRKAAAISTDDETGNTKRVLRETNPGNCSSITESIPQQDEVSLSPSFVGEVDEVVNDIVPIMSPGATDTLVDSSPPQQSLGIALANMNVNTDRDVMTIRGGRPPGGWVLPPIDEDFSPRRGLRRGGLAQYENDDMMDDSSDIAAMNDYHNDGELSDEEATLVAQRNIDEKYARHLPVIHTPARTSVDHWADHFAATITQSIPEHIRESVLRRVAGQHLQQQGVQQLQHQVQQQQQPPPPPDSDEDEPPSLTVAHVLDTVDEIYAETDDAHLKPLEFYQNEVIDRLDIHSIDLTAGRRVIINDHVRMLKQQPSVEQINEFVDEWYVKFDSTNANCELVYYHVQSKSKLDSIGLSSSTKSHINKRLWAWKRGIAIQKLEVNDESVDLVHTYPSMKEFVKKERINDPRSHLLRRGGFADGDYFYRYKDSATNGSTVLTDDHIIAKVNGTENNIELLTFTGGTLVKSPHEYESLEACLHITPTLGVGMTKLWKCLKGGVYIEENNNASPRCLRYKFTKEGTKGRPSLGRHKCSDENIIAKLEDTDTMVLQESLPELRLEANFFSFELFLEKFTGKISKKRSKRELKSGGFVMKDTDGKLYFFSFKFPSNRIGGGGHHCPMLSRVEKLSKYLKVKMKSQKYRTLHIKKDVQEMRCLVEGTGTELETFVFSYKKKDNVMPWHATVFKPEEMERNDDDSISIIPLNQLDHDTKSRLELYDLTPHDDIFWTNSFLHSAIHSLNSKAKESKTEYVCQPFGVFYLILLEQHKDSSATICGLGRGGVWTGHPGVYKSVHPRRIVKVIKVQLGSLGNMSDPDSKFTLIRDNMNMDKKLTTDLKIGLKENTKQYHNGVFDMHIEEDGNDDDQSIGIEKVYERGDNVTAVQDDILLDVAEKKIEVNTAIELAKDDILEKAISLGSLEEEEGIRRIIFADLKSDTKKMVKTKIGRVRLSKAFKAAHSEWKTNGARQVEVHDSESGKQQTIVGHFLTSREMRYSLNNNGAWVKTI